MSGICYFNFRGFMFFIGLGFIFRIIIIWTIIIFGTLPVKADNSMIEKMFSGESKVVTLIKPNGTIIPFPSCSVGSPKIFPLVDVQAALAFSKAGYSYISPKISVIDYNGSPAWQLNAEAQYRDSDKNIITVPVGTGKINIIANIACQ